MQIGSASPLFQQPTIPQNTSNLGDENSFSQAFEEQGLQGLLDETDLDPSLLEQQAEQMEQASLLGVGDLGVNTLPNTVSFEPSQIQDQVQNMSKLRIETDTPQQKLGASPLQNGALENIGKMTATEKPIQINGQAQIFTEAEQSLTHHKVTIEDHIQHAVARQAGVLEEKSAEVMKQSPLFKDFSQQNLLQSEALTKEGVQMEEGRFFAHTESKAKTVSIPSAISAFNQEQQKASVTELKNDSIKPTQESLEEIFTDSQNTDIGNDMTAENNMSIEKPQDLFTRDLEQGSKVQETKSTEQRVNLEKIASQIQFKKEDDQVKELVLELHPKHLGSMRMKLSQEGDQLSVEMLVGSIEAKQMVESDLASLREMLMEREDMEFQQLQLAVDVEQNPFQQSGQQAERGRFREDYSSNDVGSPNVVEPSASQVYKKAVNASGLNLYA